MDSNKLKEILEKHKKWLKGQKGGERANLCGVDLTGVKLSGADLRCSDLHEADLHDADLRCANLGRTDMHGAKLLGAELQCADLHGSDLSGADLRCADLTGTDLYCADLGLADLCDANLSGANLRSAYLCYANLCRANLRGAYLCYVNICGADLCGSDLCGANLCDVKNAENITVIPMTCPDHGSFTAWKKASGYIVKLLIPEDARRSSATWRKCRCDKAIVVAIETIRGEPADLDEVSSDYDNKFIYRVGETVTEPKFCEDRFRECAEGIHFFINRQEAVAYL